MRVAHQSCERRRASTGVDARVAEFTTCPQEWLLTRNQAKERPRSMS